MNKVKSEDIDAACACLDKEIARMENMDAADIMEHWDLISWRKKLNSLKKVFYHLLPKRQLK
jgi:hypothetical protein